MELNTTQPQVENSLEALPHLTEREAAAQAPASIRSMETDPNYVSHFEMQQKKANEELQKKFAIEGDIFFFKDRNGLQAFKDAGNKITTAHNDPRIAEATVLLAQSKGWSNIKVSGHPDFKREVWLQASLKGLQVEGYKPSEMDLAALELAREKPGNAISKALASPNGALPHEVDANPKNRDPKEAGERLYQGEILEQGRASYQHRPDGQPSYFIKLRDQAGQEQTIWGKDLERATQESGVKVGETASIRYLGNKPVTVLVEDKDKNGAVIGKRNVLTKRNTWTVEKNEVVREVAKQVLKGKNVDQKTIKKIDQVIKEKQEEMWKQGRKTPGVRIFDRSAPRSKMQKTQEVERERQRERVIDRSR